MKKIWILCLAFALLALSACGSGSDTASAFTPEPTLTPSPTPAPDFSGTDFSGRWYVHEIIDSNGKSLSDAEMQDLDAGFTLELIPGGAYFVYDEGGRVLGQGDYAVTLDRLALRAGKNETVYEIVDGDTLRAIQPDGSITVMKRMTETCADDDGAATETDTVDGDDSSE